MFGTKKGLKYIFVVAVTFSLLSAVVPVNMLPVQNATAQVLDTTPPSITDVFDSPDPFSPNSDGIKDTTTVSFTSNEPGTYTLQILNATLMGGQNVTGTMVPGVNNVTWTGSGFTGPVPDGIYQYLIEADDAAGNRGYGGLPMGSNTITVDTVDPTITAAVTPTPNLAGWNNQTSVTVSFDCVDNVGGSGIFDCTDPMILTEQGVHNVTGIATDYANNTASILVMVKIDTIAPTIAAIVSPAPNVNGWNNQTSVTVSYLCADTGGSGIASCLDSVALTNSVVFTAEGIYNATGIAIDNAGNQANATATVRIDRTAPNLTVPATQYIEANATGFAVVNYPAANATDNLTPTPDIVIVCDPLSGSTFPLGINNVTCTATDLAMNVNSTSFEVRVQEIYIGSLPAGIIWGSPLLVNGTTKGAENDDQASLTCKVGASPIFTSLTPVPGDIHTHTWQAVCTYTPGDIPNNPQNLTAQLIDNPVRATSDPAFIDVLKRNTTLTMDPGGPFLVFTNVTIGGTSLTDDHIPDPTRNGISGRLITFNGTFPSTTTIGLNFTNPSSIIIRDCPSPDLGGTFVVGVHECLGDSTQVPGDMSNQVLHLNVTGSIVYPMGTQEVRSVFQDTGCSDVTVRYDEAGSASFSVVTYRVDYNTVIAYFTFPGGIEKLTVMGVAQLGAASCPGVPAGLITNPLPGTAGFSHVQTSNNAGFPILRLDQDFEERSSSPATPYGTLLTTNDGSFFSVANFTNAMLVNATFAGDDRYKPSSGTQAYEVLDDDPKATSGVANFVADAGTGIFYDGCALDTDQDAICDTDEINGYIQTSIAGDAGRFYICPGAGPLNINPCGLSVYHKDLFVEVDSMPDRGLTDADVDALELMFDNAPVENPDQTPGINLVILRDETLTYKPVFRVFTDSVDDADSENDFFNVKQRHFGTTTEQGGLLLNDNTLLKEGKAQIYHYAVLGATIGQGATPDCAGGGTLGVSENPPSNDFVVAIGCSNLGAQDPNDTDGVDPVLRLGTPHQLRGVFAHELGHNLGLHHAAPVKIANKYALVLNAPLTQNTATVGVTQTNTFSNIVTPKTVSVSGLSVTTTGAFRGFVKVDQIITLNAPSTITVGTTTKPTGAGLNPDIPYATITSGAGTSTQTLTRFIPISSTGAVGPVTLGSSVTRLTFSPAATINDVTTGAGSPSITTDVPSAIYSLNCNVNNPSIMGYSYTMPDLLDADIYFNTDGTYNSAYTPGGWRLDYSRGNYATINEASVLEGAGISEVGYATPQEVVFSYGTANLRYAATGMTYVGAATGIDFNQSGVIQLSVNTDLNDFMFVGCGLDSNGVRNPRTGEILRSIEDWRNLNFYFRDNAGQIDSHGFGEFSDEQAEDIEFFAQGYGGTRPPLDDSGDRTEQLANNVINQGRSLSVKIILNDQETGEPLPELTTVRFKVIEESNPPNSNPRNEVGVFTWQPKTLDYKYVWGTKGFSPGEYRLEFSIIDPSTGESVFLGGTWVRVR